MMRNQKFGAGFVARPAADNRRAAGTIDDDDVIYELLNT